MSVFVLGHVRHHVFELAKQHPIVDFANSGVCVCAPAEGHNAQQEITTTTANADRNKHTQLQEQGEDEQRRTARQENAQDKP